MRFNYWILCVFSSLSALGGTQFYKVNELPGDLRTSVSSSRMEGGSVLKGLDLSRLKLNFNGRDRFSVELPGAERLYQQGMPVVPSMSEAIPNKEGFETELVLQAEEVERSVGAIPFELTPKTFVWSEDTFFPTFKSEGLFPGKFIQTSKLAKQTLVNIFPVQVDLKTGETFILRKSSLWVRYTPKAVSFELPRFGSLRSLIVTTRALETSAKELASHHLESSRLLSQILFVEDLEKEPMVAEDLLPDGYKNGEDKNEIVAPFDSSSKTGYNYELAKKLIHYLQERMSAKGSALQYVTLLGTSEQVPPSYYFTLPAVFGKKWGVTDQCYGSLKNCLEPRLAVGRLPFGTTEEVTAYLVKARAYSLKNQTPKQELSLIAGKAFPNAEVYVGELGTLRTIQDPSTDWNGVNKIFRTKFNYLRKTLLTLASGQNDSRFVYALDHGKGNQWFVEHEFVSSDDIEKTSAIENPNHPVVVSIACSNAAFDQELMKEPIFGNARYGTKSVGNTLLRARGGAVAYWGEARPGLGNPVYRFDLKGNLDLQGSTYGLQLLEGFFEKYRKQRRGRVGDLILQAQRAFALERGNNMSEQGNAWSYYITTLLGDPTLVLPVRPDLTVENGPIGESKTVFEKGTDLPILYFNSETKFDLGFSSLKPVDATLFQWVESEFGAFMAEKVVAESKGIVGNSSLTVDLFPEDSYGTYFLRLENTQGVPRERQVWFKARPH